MMMMKMINKNESFERGNQTENLFVHIAKQKNYKIQYASKDENINKHIDVYVLDSSRKYAVDIKAQKREKRNLIIQDEWHVIEFIAVHSSVANNKNIEDDSIFNPNNPDFSIGSNRPGWVFGKADIIAFECNHVFLLVDRLALLNKTKTLIDFSKKVKNSVDAKYCVFTRKNRGDLISYIHKKDLEQIVFEKWFKPIDLTNVHYFCS